MADDGRERGALGFDANDFPLWRRGRSLRDFKEGQEINHHWGRTLNAGDNSVFSAATCSWNPTGMNTEFARSHGHADVVVNPMLVLCTAVGLSVEDLSEGGGPFLGVDEVAFGVPVYPGDTLTARSLVRSVRTSLSRPGWGIVSWATTATNQRGEVVVSLVRTNLVADSRQP